MSERFQHRNPVESSRYFSSANVQRRWLAYNHSFDPETGEKIADFNSIVVELSDLRGHETGIDVGCSTGDLLRQIKLQGHTGHLIGIEPREFQFFPLQMEVENGIISGLELVKGLGHRLVHNDGSPVADSSIDRIWCIFTLYEMPKTIQASALKNFTRKLAPDGMAIIATSSHNNKLKHRQFEKDVAEAMSSPALKFKAPPMMNRRFNTKRAEYDLPKYFKHVVRVPVYGEMRFTADNYQDYLESLISMQREFQPTPQANLYMAAIDHVVRPAILREINDPQKGYFSDSMERDIFICRNPIVPE